METSNCAIASRGTVSVEQTDPAGNTSPATSTTFTDTDAPVAPAAVDVTQNPDGTIAITGTGEPGSTVSATLPDGSTVTGTVQPDGTFSVTSPTPQTTGSVSVEQTDAAGNTSPATSTTFTDTDAPLAPAAVAVTQNPDGTLTVSGTGEPGATISATLPDGSTITGTVQPDGTFSVTSPTPQTTGSVSVEQTDPAGNTSPATSTTFTDTDAPLAPAAVDVTQNPDGTVTVSGTGEPGSTVSATLPDGSTITGTVQPDGTFAVTSPTPQTTGAVSVEQTDAAGNTSPATATTIVDRVVVSVPAETKLSEFTPEPQPSTGLAALGGGIVIESDNPILNTSLQMTETWQQDELRRHDMSSDPSSRLQAIQFRLELGERAHGLQVVATSSNRMLSIGLSGIPGLKLASVVDVDVRQLDGSPLPSWLEGSPLHQITGLAPEGIEFIDLHVRVVLSDGTTVSRNIRVDAATGEIEELPDRRTDAGPGKHKRAAADFDDENIERIARALVKATG